MGNALCLIFQADQQSGLTCHAGKGGLVHLFHGAGQLLLDHFPGKAGHLGHSCKLGTNGIQIFCRRSSGHGFCFIPGRGIGILRRRHIQHDIRCGNGLLQSGALSIGQVAAEFQNTVVLKIISVGILQCSRILFAHQKREGIQCALAHSLRQGAFNAALLDAGVHDPARVIRQGKVAVGLHEQQSHHGKAGGPVAG